MQREGEMRLGAPVAEPRKGGAPNGNATTARQLASGAENRTHHEHLQVREGCRPVKIGRCVLGERQKRGGGRFRLGLLRLREIEALAAFRFGAAIPDGRDTADLDDCLALVKAAAASATGQNVVDWCRRWAPWLPAEMIAAIESEFGGRRRMLSAIDCGALVELTEAERTALQVRTIAVSGQSEAERREAAAERKRTRDRERIEAKRRLAGVRPRGEFEAASLSANRPWESEGISRRTWERRRRAAGASRVLIKNGVATDLRQTDEQSIIPEQKPDGCAAANGGGSGPQAPAGVEGQGAPRIRDKITKGARAR